MRFECRTACMRPLTRTTCSRTSIRSAIWRRRFNVSSSATQTSGRKPAACSRARIAASILSVLNPRVGYCSHQTRVRNSDTFDVRPQQPLDRGTVTSCLDDDLVLLAECLGEVHQGAVNKVNAQLVR